MDVAQLIPMVTTLIQTLPSFRERNGIRVPTQEANNLDDMLQMTSNRFTLLANNSNPESFLDVPRQASLDRIPNNTQLNLFATSGDDALKNYLNSDAVTGMGIQDLKELNDQYNATSTLGDLTANYFLRPVSNYMINKSNSDPNMLDSLNGQATLMRLLRMLQK